MITVAVVASANGDNTIIAAAAGYKFRVIAWFLSFSGTVNAKWKDGAATDLTGLIYGVAATNAHSPSLPRTAAGPAPQFDTGSGNALVLNLSAGTAVGGYVVYERLPASA